MEELEAKRAKQKEEDDIFFAECAEQQTELMARLEIELEEAIQRRDEGRRERAEELEQINEMAKLAVERRREEEAEIKRRREEEKEKKQGGRKKKQEMMAGAAKLGTGDGKPNFVLPKKEGAGAEPGSQEAAGIMPAGAPSSLKPEDLAEAKLEFMRQFADPLELDDCEESDLRAKIKTIHARIAKLEATKYDLEEKQKRQDYDLREKRDRYKMKLKKTAEKLGLDPEEYAAAKHPYKLKVMSDSDRQIDRRSYGERKHIYATGDLPLPPKAVLHGTPKPPSDWGRTAHNEDLEILRKAFEENNPLEKYKEIAPIEGAKPPVKPIPLGPVPVDEAPPPPFKEEAKAAPAADAAPAEAEPPAEE